MTGKVIRAMAAAALMSAAGLPAGAQTLTDTLIAAYRNSNLLEQNRAVLRAADEDAASAVAALRPTLNFIATSGYSKTVLYGEGLAHSIGLSAQLTLFDSGQRNLSLDIARESVLATRDALVGVEQDVLLEAVTAHIAVRRAEEFVALNQNSVRVIGEALQAARDRFEVGEVTRTDVAQAEARLAGGQASLSSAQGDLSVGRERYRAATGAYPTRLSAPPAPPAIPRTLDEAKAIGVRTHPALRQAQRQVTIAELNVALAAAQRKPSIGLSGEASRNDSGQDTSSVGLQFVQPLYQGGGLSALHRRAIAGRDQSRAALAQTAVQVEYGVGAAWSSLQVARASVTALEESVRAARSAYEGVSEEARLGARTTLDVLDAEQDLLNASTDRVAAQSQTYVALYSLLQAMGLLTVEHLQLGIATYDPAAYYNAVRNAPFTSLQGERLDRVLRSTGRN